MYKRQVEYRDKKGKNLSGGLKRLTSFAMALIGSADIMLLDEPTNDVDPVRREKQWQLLKKLAYKGHTIIIVTPVSYTHLDVYKRQG